MNDKIEISNAGKTPDTNRLLLGIETLIEKAGRNVAVYLNTEINRLYWSIGNHIITEMQYETYSQRGQQNLATLSRTLTEKFGKGYTHSALTRMIKVAETYDERKFATLSQTLSWSHFIELQLKMFKKEMIIKMSNKKNLWIYAPAYTALTTKGNLY
ncbi:MAG: DUF1016 N-terminal domain-containing protein [Chitinophagaceae bacterium]|nr:DUF1016 N-terminal domain-containing protein [Chitinophagaceae bacterium]